MRFLTPIVAAMLVCVACATPAILEPRTGPNTEYPCGVDGVECPGHMCCDEGEVCGGQNFSGCPSGACCYAPAAGEVGARPAHPQWCPR